MYAVAFLAILARLAAAQNLAMFTMTFAPSYTQGGEYNLTYTATADPISIILVSGNYSQVVIANDVAGSPYLWTVPDIVPGTYQLQLLDDGVQSDVSLDFQIIAPALPPALGGNNGTTATPTTSVTALTSTATTTASDPGFTTTVYDEECGCQRTTTFAGEAEASAYAAASASAYASAGVGPAAAEASATAAASASASAGAEAGAGQTPAVGVGSGPASNYTAPLITPSLATYVANGASRVSGSAGVAAALFAVFLAAA